MNDAVYRSYARGLTWLVILAALAHALVVFGTPSLPAAGTVLDFLLLLAPAAIAARWASSATGRPTARLAPAFVLAAWAARPGPAGLGIALLAALAAGGGGVAGAYRRGPAAFAGIAVAGAAGQFFTATLFAPDPWSPRTLFHLLLLFPVLQGLAFALAVVLEQDIADSLLDREGPGWRTLMLEAANVPLAWLLGGLLASGERLAAAATAVLALAGLCLLRRHGRALDELRGTNDALSERLAELATLHAVGRAILSSTDPARIFTAIERECRTVFSIDDCTVLLLDRESSRLRTVYRRRRGQRADTSGRAPVVGFAAEVFRTRGARRVDDLAPHGGSAMAAPLLVDGEPIGVLWVEADASAAYDAQALALLGTVAQQVAVAVENARHFRMATVDSLTGFFVRDYFFRRLDDEQERVQRYGGSFGLLMVDVDGFKEINDRDGHLAGDHHLREIAATIRTQLRAADVACRYGGDEFCLLLPETDLAGARAIAERVREAVAQRRLGADGASPGATVSIGVAACPEHDARDLRELMRHADQALYRAKRSGRDRVVPFAA